MKLYRNTDDSFGCTDTVFNIDEAVLEMKPTLKQWAQERINSGEYDGTIVESYADLIADFVAQCEEVEND